MINTKNGICTISTNSIAIRKVVVRYSDCMLPGEKHIKHIMLLGMPDINATKILRSSAMQHQVEVLEKPKPTNDINARPLPIFL